MFVSGNSVGKIVQRLKEEIWCVCVCVGENLGQLQMRGQVQVLVTVT